MKPSEVFGVVVRSVGLLLLVSVANMPLMLVAQPGLLIIAIPMSVIGIWLLRGAPALIHFAYPQRDIANDRVSMRTDDLE